MFWMAPDGVFALFWWSRLIASSADPPPSPSTAPLPLTSGRQEASKAPLDPPSSTDAAPRTALRWVPSRRPPRRPRPLSPPASLPRTRLALAPSLAPLPPLPGALFLSIIPEPAAVHVDSHKRLCLWGPAQAPPPIHSQERKEEGEGEQTRSREGRQGRGAGRSRDGREEQGRGTSRDQGREGAGAGGKEGEGGARTGRKRKGGCRCGMSALRGQRGATWGHGGQRGGMIG